MEKETQKELAFLSQEQIRDKLKQHQLWLDNGEGEPADFSYCEFTGVDFSGVDLTRANFTGAYIRSGNLNHTILNNANFCRATLISTSLEQVTGENVNFSYARLNYIKITGGLFDAAKFNKATLYASTMDMSSFDHAIFEGATITSVSFRNSMMKYVIMNNLEITDASFKNAVLLHADFSATKFKECQFNWSNLCCADFEDAEIDKYTEFEGATMPHVKFDEKERIRTGIILDAPLKGYKKCKDGYIVELIIPKGAVVFSINNNKCRTNKATVVDIVGSEFGAHVTQAVSRYDASFIYQVGQDIEIENFNLQSNVECGSGIHFFRTLEEAKDYF